MTKLRRYSRVSSAVGVFNPKSADGAECQVAAYRHERGANPCFAWDRPCRKQLNDQPRFGPTPRATTVLPCMRASGRADTYGSGIAVGTRRHCTVNIVMVGDRVSSVNYLGPSGGLLTQGEQCAFAVESCVR